jgi:hypothetical protein|tara:strand:- start:420 stop:743 length:324 start_codon:yes stop_codon:yes gene_type:complete
MAKILETKLPIAIGEISPETFNRLVRVLELSLGKVDVGATPAFNETQRNENKFEQGDIIWNLSTKELQLWNGEEWIILYEREQFGVEGVASLGKITVSTGGATTITI